MLARAHWFVLVSTVLGSFVAPLAAGATPASDLAKLCDEFWVGSLRASPTFATELGEHRWDDRLGDPTPAALEREEQRLRAVLARATAIGTAALSPADRLTRSALVLEVQNRLDDLGCHAELWVVDPLGGPQVEFMNLVDYTRLATPQDARNFVARCRAMGPFLDAHVANLRRGLAKSQVASVDPVRKVIEELDG